MSPVGAVRDSCHWASTRVTSSTDWTSGGILGSRSRFLRGTRSLAGHFEDDPPPSLGLLFKPREEGSRDPPIHPEMGGSRIHFRIGAPPGSATLTRKPEPPPPLGVWWMDRTFGGGGKKSGSLTLDTAGHKNNGGLLSVRNFIYLTIIPQISFGNCIWV